ncbi:MAG: transposase [Sphingomonadales bacterium]|nr:MAG: transposase [Sphingomonadales bacterium]
MSDETDFETCFETNTPGRVERLDVIESPRGKRHWTPEARARIIAESLEPGVNVSAVARRHGIYPQQLYTWRRGLRERAEAMSFVPAMVERENASLLSGAASQSVGGQIVIETSGLSIRIPSDVSADHIERVLLAVRVNA